MDRLVHGPCCQPSSGCCGGGARDGPVWLPPGADSVSAEQVPSFFKAKKFRKLCGTKTAGIEVGEDSACNRCDFGCAADRLGHEGHFRAAQTAGAGNRLIAEAPEKAPELFQIAAVAAVFKNRQFRRFVYSDVIYFFALTLFQTGLAFYETKLMGIEDTWTFVLTATMTFISVLLYPFVNKLAPKLGKKKLIITGFFSYALVFLITSVCGTGLHWGFIVAVCASVPMAILGILPQACVADVSELSRLETGEDRSGMFFAARTFAFKMGQALAMVVFTSVTVSETQMSYRATAIIATVTCLIGAFLFFLYNEKSILETIRRLKGAEED